MKKRFFAWMMAVVMIMSLIPGAAFATENLPNAEVSDLGSITVTNSEGNGDYKFNKKYFKYDLLGNSELAEETEAFALQIAMEFVAKDTPEEAAENAYANYTTDFFITFEGIKEGSFNANGCYLAGYYPSFENWVVIPLDGFTVENGKIYPVITSAGFDFKYVDICSSVKDFICGIYMPDEVLAANPNLTVKLDLGLSETLDEAQKGTYIEVDSYTYNVSNMMDCVASVTSGEGESATTGYYADLAKAVAAADDGNTVTLLKDVELTETLIIDKAGSITIDGNRHKITQAEGYTDTWNALIMMGTSTLGDAEAATHNYTIQNVVFDGIDDWSVIRAQGVTLTMDGCTVQNCEHTRGNALLRLDFTESTIKNSTFKNNETLTLIGQNYNADGASDSAITIDNCVFEKNTVNGPGVFVLSSDGGCTIKNSEFIENAVTTTNGATVYLGFAENCSITGNLFKNNTVAGNATSNRIAGALFVGYTNSIAENAFIGNSATNASGTAANSVCVDTYYGKTIDLSENYWGGTAPDATAIGTNTAAYVYDSYYTTYTNGVLGGLAKSLIFNANGGSFAETSDSEISGFFASLPTVSRSGYTFNGWFTAASGGTKVTAVSGIEADTTLYAQWTYNAPVYDDNDNDYIPVTPSNPTVDKEVTENKDGSTTTTETKKDGTVIETTENTDGSTVTTETKTEVKETATSTTTTTTTETVTKDANGNQETVKTEEKVVETADTTTTTTKTETKTDAKTETVEVVETVKVDEAGNETTTVETKTETKLDNGSTGTTTVAADGTVTAEAKVTTTAVTEASKDEAPVTLPIASVPVTNDTETAATVDIDVPASAGEVTVEIPVENVTPGTVVVLVDENGNETVVNTTGTTENGVVINVEGDVTVKVVDNSKDFEDVQEGDWYSDAADFASSRELMNGMDEDTFGHNVSTSRAMVAQILHNMEGKEDHNYEGSFNDVDEDDWYADAVHWAADNDIISGTGNGNFDPMAPVTREQLAVMLWKYAGSEDSDHYIGHFNDDHEISSWAETAMKWAVEHGLMSGKGNGQLDPKGEATRAEVASVLMNFYKNVKY